MSAPDPNRRTRSEQLAADLSREILSGALDPGSRLDEHSIAQRFGVSRTPVREALKQLAGLELITIRPHRGAVVADLQAVRMGELFEALAEAEAVCARLAAIKMSGLERERLEAAHRAFMASADVDDREAIPELNRAFHEAIYAGAHNAFLSDTVTALRRRLSPFTRAQFRSEERPTHSAREHAAVLDAVMRRDGAGAEEAMRRHVLAVGRAWAEWSARVEA